MNASAAGAVAIALALAACEPRGGAADSTGAVAAPDTAAVQARADSAREIYIDSIVPGNPLVVRGRARTFENTVQVRARDSAGTIITEVFTTSVGEMGTHNPYEARLWLVRDPGARVTIEAFEYSANDGSVRSLVSRTVPLASSRMPLTLVFPADDCAATVAVTRTVPRTVSVAQLLMHALVSGPTDAEKAAGATSPFPPGSRVESVNLRDGVVTVDFNDRLQNVGGACAARAIRTAVSSTLTRLSGVRGVRITAGGSEALALQP